MIQRFLNRTSYTRVIALSFLIVILIGTVCLHLPIATRARVWTPISNALFTATSATCVTGLVVYDTWSYWSVFGQIVILMMIQVGGIGLMTFITMIFIFMKKKIGLHERMLLMHSAGNMRVGGMVRLIKRILSVTAACELCGAALLAVRFVPLVGWPRGLYYALFHSVSAFCNAGFDLMGRFGPYSSFTTCQTDPLVSLTLMALIVMGGMGFLVWDDLITKRSRVSQYTLHTKIVLSATAALIAGGTLGFFLFERDGLLAGLTLPQQLLSASFLSVTTRTAGFNTMNLTQLSESSTLLSCLLMYIGGNPGSTAGGVKTSTVAAVILTTAAMSRGNTEVTAFKKRLETGLVKQAAAVMLLYMTAILLSAMTICHIEDLNMGEVLFEVVSAAGTVGLSKGLTPRLGLVSHALLIIMMYGGRIGGLSFLMIFREKQTEAELHRPSEKILIG